MNSGHDRPASEETSVTWVITQNVRPEKREEFEAWLSGITEAGSHFAGHQGFTVLRPEEGSKAEYVILARFATYQDLRRWEDSTERAHWLQLLEPLVVEPPTYRTESGLETWFQLPGHKVVVPPPKYKMAALILLAIYPLILIVVPLMGWVAGDDRSYLGVPVRFSAEYLTRTLVTAVILVILMTWVAMPQLTRLARPWLYPTR